MTPAERVSIARRLQATGNDAGVHPEHGVVVYWSRRIWRVAGGDVQSPSLIGLAGVRLDDVQWITRRQREEPVT